VCLCVCEREREHVFDNACMYKLLCMYALKTPTWDTRIEQAAGKCYVIVRVCVCPYICEFMNDCVPRMPFLKLFAHIHPPFCCEPSSCAIRMGVHARVCVCT